jgi:hypothetical protein
MAPTGLQKLILKHLAPLRSERSYAAGGLVLNRNWARLSDDLDIFHDSDNDISEYAQKDIYGLQEAGFGVHVDIEVYGCIEARISGFGESTLIQWMSETRHRFFPIVKDPEWGMRLHDTDLAINKVIASSTRAKARDAVDLITISQNYCPIGALVMAATGKPPNFSPVRSIEEIRRRALSVDATELTAVRGIPISWTPTWIRDHLIEVLDKAEEYVRNAPVDLVGVVVTDDQGVPVEITESDMRNSRITRECLQVRQASSEPDPVPASGDHLDPEWEPPTI